MELFLISCGAGEDSITLKAIKTAALCDVLMGSERLLTKYGAGKKCVTLPADSAKAADMINGLSEHTVGVLLSGDAGFYSQATQLRCLVSNRTVQTIPGVGIVQAVAAKVNAAWQDCHLISLHANSGDPLDISINNSYIILLRAGIDLSAILPLDCLDNHTVTIISALGEAEESVRCWDGCGFISPPLTTLYIQKKA